MIQFFPEPHTQTTPGFFLQTSSFHLILLFSRSPPTTFFLPLFILFTSSPAAFPAGKNRDGGTTSSIFCHTSKVILLVHHLRVLGQFYLMHLSSSIPKNFPSHSDFWLLYNLYSCLNQTCSSSHITPALCTLAVTQSHF